MEPDCDPGGLSGQEAKLCQVVRLNEGRRLFREETFEGNGRTCETCHQETTGTINAGDVLGRLTTAPDDPLFVHDGLDQGTAGVSRILEHATIRITLPLPADVALKSDADATRVTFNRGIPTTLNTPALDHGVLMHDLRDLSLEEQALGAIKGHAQNGREPTLLELELIAEFQKSSRFFSSGALRKFADGGDEPRLPPGNTKSEQRGRLFFIDTAFTPGTKTGVCALCHSGPMLNAANLFSPPVFGNPPGARLFSVLVSERNVLGNPLHTFLIDDTLGDPIEVTTPDLGVLMTDHQQLIAEGHIPPDFVLQQFGLRRAFFSNFFKTPTLWGIAETAPYFHDNSAKTIEDMLDHYNFFFLALPVFRGMQLTEQDKADIEAFLSLL
jgi:cytochrome c peroxidase